MNLVVELRDYLAPVTVGMSLCLGEWDESPGESNTEFLSINMDGGARPGVISRSSIIELYYVSPAGSSDSSEGKFNAFNKAYAISQYIVENPKSRCFANIILFTDIIGPKVTERMRNVYQITVEITY